MDDGSAYRIVRYRSAESALPECGAGRLLLLPLDGEIVVRWNGTDTRLVPGAAALLPAPRAERDDGAVPHPRRNDIGRTGAQRPDTGRAGDVLAMTVPARELAPAPPEPLLMDVSKGLGRVVADMARTVGEEADTLGPSEFEAVCDRIAELLRMLVAGRTTERPSAPGHLAEVEAVVRRYVRAHVTDPALTGTVLAQRLGWSLRQIQLALQRAGTTPRALIREERLRLVRGRLRDPADQAVSITDLAHAAGFSSAGALSTAFRRRFGVSPRDLRRAAQRDQVGTGAD